MCRRASAAIDAEMAEFARQATVSQLTRALGSYRREGDPVTARPVEDSGGAPEEEVRPVSVGYEDDGTWRLSAHLPADQGALVEQALVERRDALFHSGESEEASAARVSWADALVGVAEASLAGAAHSRPHGERHQLLVHLGVDDGRRPRARRAALPDSLRPLPGCDGSAEPVWERHKVALSVGRAQRIVPSDRHVGAPVRRAGRPSLGLLQRTRLGGPG